MQLSIALPNPTSTEEKVGNVEETAYESDCLYWSLLLSKLRDDTSVYHLRTSQNIHQLPKRWIWQMIKLQKLVDYSI